MATVCEPMKGHIVEICQTMGSMRLATCEEAPTRRSRRLRRTAVLGYDSAGSRQLHLVQEVVSDYRKCLGYEMFLKDFPSCELIQCRQILLSFGSNLCGCSP
mmetsp:Transcript_898/g.744  ORF Transcript_898/g.744 Transcript_898/m.744 type:complete len:102 (+) Transcript_898:112-417(+)